MSDVVIASNGKGLPVGDLPITIGYTGSNVTSLTVAYQGITYVQTLTYTGSNVTAISRWEAQP